ncbi:MAG: enoyl-CoA hydratase/isomerase family protein [Chloroflexi bacterium]|nr:MAG: enoyl-CoA hydratase/isomerase family protein [Chloroflexota bacterium]
MPDLRIEREGSVAVLTIDRPQARNAIGLNTMAELDEALAGLEDEEIRCAVITGAGDRAFVAGGDLRELESVTSEDFAAEMAVRMRRTLDRIASLPIPVIAAVNGAALGGGAEVAVGCDYRIAAHDARIGFTQVLLGLMPAWGGIERLCALVGRGRALYLLTTGSVLTGREAAELGLVEESVARDRFEARWRELAEQVARAPRPALAGIKRAVQAALPGSRPDLEAAAVRDFARAWTDPRHWEMAAELERQRRQRSQNP